MRGMVSKPGDMHMQEQQYSDSIKKFAAQLLLYYFIYSVDPCGTNGCNKLSPLGHGLRPVTDPSPVAQPSLFFTPSLDIAKVNNY